MASCMSRAYHARQGSGNCRATPAVLRLSALRWMSTGGAMRNRGARWAVVVVLIIAMIAVAWRRCGGGGAGGTASREPAEGTAAVVGPLTGSGSAVHAPNGDPRALQRGAIRGTVREDGGPPIAGATVCASWYAEALGAEETREPICATTDASGAYALVDLVPATYTIDANAPHHVPARWRDDRKHDDVRIKAGETRAPIDLALEGGAVEVKGVVDDINGGPVAGAM